MKRKDNNMSDDFCKRLHSCYPPQRKIRKNNDGTLVLAFFALSSFFSILAFFIALLALIK